MKRYGSVALLILVISLFVGALPASATVSSLSASKVSVANGRVKAIEGSIICTTGMKFNVRANATDGSGNTAIARAGGTCTGSTQAWKSSQVTSGTGFSCGENVLVRGHGRTIQDNARRFMPDTNLRTCAAAGPRNPGDILLMDNTNVTDSVKKALDELGYSYTHLADDTNWTDNSFAGYETVIIAIDGGGWDHADLAAVRTGVIDAGRRLILVGGAGSCDFASAVDGNLVSVDTVDCSWEPVAGSPDLTVLLPAHGLAAGLPATYDFVDPVATFYMAIPNAADHTPVAKNGDNVTNLLHRDFGAGSLVWFTSPPTSHYWLNAADFAVLKTIVGNALTLPD